MNKSDPRSDYSDPAKYANHFPLTGNMIEAKVPKLRR